MKRLKKKRTTETIIEALVCDKCGRVAEYDDYIEFQEFITIPIWGGYGSVFGDGCEIECDLCQHCIKELLGDYFHLVEK